MFLTRTYLTPSQVKQPYTWLLRVLQWRYVYYYSTTDNVLMSM